MCLNYSVRLVQVIDHYVPSLAGKGFRSVTSACPGTLRGIIQAANEDRLVFLLMFLPIPTIFVRVRLLTHSAPIVVVGVIVPSRV